MRKEMVTWEGEDLKNLLTLTKKDLQLKYPKHSWDSLKRMRRRYRALARKVTMEREPGQDKPEGQRTLDKVAELFERSGIDVNEIHQVKRVNLYQMGYKDADGEAQEKDLVSVQYIPTPKEDVFEPVEPAKITPTKRKPVKRDTQLILVYGDGQVDYRRIIDPTTEEQKLIPLHNIAAHRIIQQLNARYRPETTVNLGDFADMAALSKYDPDSDHFHKTLGPSMRYIHDFYAQLTADNPNAHHVEVDSNHAVRVKKQVLRNIPALHDFVRPGETYPMMTYYYFANLGKLGIDFISGYGNAEYVYGEDYGPAILFKHGTHSSATPGATTRREAAENPEVSVVRGHGHSDEHISVTTRSGRRLFYHQIGSTCLNNGPVPGYHSSVDDHNQPTNYHNKRHQNTLSIIEDYGNGEYQVDILNIYKGVTHYRGEVFNGNEEK